MANQEKSDTPFMEWFLTIEDKSEYRKRHLIPEGDWSLKSFNQFVEARKDLLRNELARVLGLGDDVRQAEGSRG